MEISVDDDKAPAGMATVNLPSAEFSIPPDSPIDAVVISPLGVPTAVMMRPGLSCVSGEELFLHDIKKVAKTSMIADK